ncbi:MAG TPA: DNA polymerase III subunit delta' [Tepidisphaeraceae bacterium]|nr:DNA polymerase III subunit delta' [Tepidisphaeraceae bacterium]
MSQSGWQHILGQRDAVEFLRHAAKTDRLPHGMIFAGPVGVGKATTAAALAQWFLCAAPNGDTACGACESCRLMAAGNHPDYHVIKRELIRYHDKTGKSKGIDLSIQVIRPELIEPANRKPMMGRGKVFIVEEADLMNAAAQNSLLKTLEEPAGRTIIMLLTASPDGLLPTVRSRCQLVRFAPLPAELVIDQLKSRGLSAAVVHGAAELSDGSLGGALRLIDDGIVEPAAELTSRIDALLRGQAAADLAEWLKKNADAYAQRQLDRDELASKDAAARQGLALYLSLAARRLRAALGDANDPDRLEQICTAIDSLARCLEYLDANVTVSLALEQLSVSLSRELTAV